MASPRSDLPGLVHFQTWTDLQVLDGEVQRDAVSLASRDNQAACPVSARERHPVHPPHRSDAAAALHVRYLHEWQRASKPHICAGRVTTARSLCR
ncbi:hypothetical protein EJB05_46920 [Eragrostis curvula]|uniref:Uncharacterized protein n=1 Tax=Eragrostis curvula TaxID=38414 RepID=A0A5J9T6J3_9POAL|nr:hypothetical protein EJB05_46920 [Eragrostis curvula]